MQLPMIASQGVITVSDASGVGEARRRIRQLAEEISLSESEREQAAIIATELATNLVRYTKGGEILLRSGSNEAKRWVDILSVDRGPGMNDVTQSLEDGHSTGGSCGTGLGAVRRLSTEFDIYSAPNSGTVVFARVADGRSADSSPPLFTWGVVSRPAPHEDLCGDSWRIAERPGELAIMLADGLGHGPEAARAAEEAARTFEADPFAPLTSLIHRADARMRGTRGGALAAARIEASGRLMKYVGVGNISGYLHPLQGEEVGRGLFSHNGTVGVQIRKVQEFDYPCPDRSLLVMYSDGLQSRWSLEPYPGLQFRHPAVFAGVLYRDFTRGRDDVTVAVVHTSLAQVA
jgi:anti-sigma regulatory factor (Ser/Thr protein kinase)